MLYGNEPLFMRSSDVLTEKIVLCLLFSVPEQVDGILQVSVVAEK